MFRTTRGPRGGLAQLTAAITAVLALALGACGSSESGPSKDEVQAGIEEIVVNGLAQSDYEVPDDVLDSYTACLTTEVYDDLSPEGRQALASKDFEESISEDDQQIVQDASTTCIAKFPEIGPQAE